MRTAVSCSLGLTSEYDYPPRNAPKLSHACMLVCCSKCCLYTIPRTTSTSTWFSPCCAGPPDQGGDPLGGYLLSDPALPDHKCMVYPTMTPTQIKNCIEWEQEPSNHGGSNVNKTACLTSGENGLGLDGSYAFTTSQGCIAKEIRGSFDWKVSTD